MSCYISSVTKTDYDDELDHQPNQSPAYLDEPDDAPPYAGGASDNDDEIYQENSQSYADEEDNFCSESEP